MILEPQNNRLDCLIDELLILKKFHPLIHFNSIPLDFNLYSYLEMKEIPEILILPSDFSCFIKKRENCLIINPRRLSEYCYAKIEKKKDIKIEMIQI